MRAAFCQETASRAVAIAETAVLEQQAGVLAVGAGRATNVMKREADLICDRAGGRFLDV